MFKNFWKRLSPNGAIRTVNGILTGVNKNRLVNSVLKAAAAGVITSALSGHTDLKTAGGAATVAAGAALVNFLKDPTAGAQPQSVD